MCICGSFTIFWEERWEMFPLPSGWVKIARCAGCGRVLGVHKMRHYYRGPYQGFPRHPHYHHHGHRPMGGHHRPHNRPPHRRSGGGSGRRPQKDRSKGSRPGGRQR